MASNKKKRSSTLIILLLAMIIMVAACVLLIKYKDKQANVDSEVDTAEDTVTIATLETDTIKSIYYSNENSEMTLVLDDEGVWKYSEDESFPVNQTYAGNMQSALSTVTSSRTITESTEGLENYGLDTPTVQVVATLKDGTSTSIAIGDEAPSADGYYATVNGSSEIYIVPTAFYNNFNYDLSDMTAIETIPTITAENITHLTVENKDKANFEVSFDESKYSDFAGFTNWTMKQPYATAIPADKTALTTLFGNYTSMSFLTCVDYSAKDLSKYELDDPTATVALEYYEVYSKDTDSTESNETADTANATDDSSTADTDTTEAETTKVNYDYELIIGSTDADGNYYAKSKDSNAVHTISADTVAKLIEIDAYSNAFHYVNLVNLEALDEVDVNINGETYTMSLEKSAETVDAATVDAETAVAETVDDAEAEVTKYYFNGELADETEFKNLYQLMIATSTEREIPAEYFESTTTKTPYMTLTYHLSAGNTVTIQYLPYDESYYVVNSNGVEYFLTDVRKINEIADAIINFQK